MTKEQWGKKDQRKNERQSEGRGSIFAIQFLLYILCCASNIAESVHPIPQDNVSMHASCKTIGYQIIGNPRENSQEDLDKNIVLFVGRVEQLLPHGVFSQFCIVVFSEVT